MKLIVIIFDQVVLDEVESILEQHDVKGFSQIPTVLGEGTTGKRLASRLHPGANSMIFSVVEDEQIDSIKSDLLQTCNANMANANCAAPVHMVVLKVEDFF